jgi:hypothetical protein
MGMIEFKTKKLAILVLSVMAFSFLGIGFNNCGSNTHNSQAYSNQNNSTYDSVVVALKQVHTGQLSSQFCSDGKNYSCLHKVFSTSATQDSNEDLGVICGTELCAKVKRYTYNTRPAEETCRQDNCDAGLEKNFNYEEYECHLKLSTQANGLYPLVAVAEEFQKSLELVHQSCLSIQKGND